MDEVSRDYDRQHQITWGHVGVNNFTDDKTSPVSNGVSGLSGNYAEQ